MSADFDKAIDRAVREMLDVEPRADLRARVMAQLPASSARLPAFGFRLPAGVWALAAAALIVLAVFVARRSQPVPQAGIAAAATDRYLPPEGPRAPAVETARIRAGATTGGVLRTPSRTAAANIVVAATFRDDTAVAGPEPLKRIAPIAVAPITQDAIAPAEIAVRPLNTITEIQFPPLTPPDRR